MGSIRIATVILVVAMGLALAGPASAQPIASELAVVNNSTKPVKLLTIKLVQFKDGQFVEEPGTQSEVARGLAPGARTKASIQPGARGKDCTSWVVVYEIGSGGGGGNINLCGKTRIVIGGTDTTEVTAE